MEDKKKRISGRDPIPQLEQGDFSIFVHRKKGGKAKRRMNLAFTILAGFLCLSILFLTLLETGYEWLPNGIVSRIAAYITESEFRDLSGGDSESKELTEDSALMEVLEGFLIPDRDFPDQGEEDEGGADWETDEPIPDPKEPLTLQTLYAFDYGAVPEGETPIIPMDLSLSEFGDAYINNATGLKPDTKKLLSMNLKDVPTLLSVNRGADPLVLILHTHGTEGYSENGAISFLDRGEDLARSSDPSQNVLAVGQVLAETLNRAGVNTLHCTVMHDQPQYKDSYRRSEETIRRYLKEYPSIRLVIDLHRDSVLKSGGELVRPVTLVDGEPTAQMMCVIGSNWNGGSYPNWEKNLALALKLRAEMNREGENICRPVYLKGSTYNQELAPYSLLVEMGASGNSLEEAKRAAEKFAMALITIAPAL